jgi:hypothetical protein
METASEMTSTFGKNIAAGTEGGSAAIRHVDGERVPDGVPAVSGNGDDGRRAWGRTARVAGATAAASLLVGTVLYLLDATDALAPTPQFRATAAGVESDVARWYAAFFARQHEILWSIALRDVLGPVAFIALTVLALAVLRLVSPARPVAVLLVVFFAVGGLLHMVSDLLYLGEISYWRQTGWSATPPVPMVITGRASEALDFATVYLEAFSYLVLACGMCCLAWLCRTHGGLRRWLGALAYAEAIGLVVLIVGIVLQADVLFQVAGLATGVVFGPAFAFLLGRRAAAALSAG